MAYANINVVQAIPDTGAPTGDTRSLTITGVTQGSTLVAVGSYYITSGIACELLSVADDKSNSWTVIENNQDAAGPGAILFAAAAHNVSAGNTNVTLTFTSHANARRIAWVLYEISGAKTSAAVALIATGDAAAGVSTVTVTTGTLAQTDNILVACFGVWANWNQGITSSGWTQALKNSNGSSTGVVVGHKKVTATTTQDVTAGSTSAPGLATTGFVLAVKAAETSGTYRYVVDNFDPADLTDSDTGITALVWRNGDYTTMLPEVYTGLSGDATPGKLVITAGLPGDVSESDDIVVRIFSSTKHSHYVVGAVELVA